MEHASKPSSKLEKQGSTQSLTHVDQHGHAHMVDVSMKQESDRTAEAYACVDTRPEVIQLIREQAIRKGDVLSVARIAGIQGAKKTSELIPLCHPIFLSHVSISLELLESSVEIRSICKVRDQTGVEMEALTAVTIAALTVYDMIKGVDKLAVIREVKLMKKSGGRSGELIRPTETP